MPARKPAAASAGIGRIESGAIGIPAAFQGHNTSIAKPLTEPPDPAAVRVRLGVSPGIGGHHPKRRQAPSPAIVAGGQMAKRAIWWRFGQFGRHALRDRSDPWRDGMTYEVPTAQYSMRQQFMTHPRIGAGWLLAARQSSAVLLWPPGGASSPVA